MARIRILFLLPFFVFLVSCSTDPGPEDQARQASATFDRELAVCLETAGISSPMSGFLGRIETDDEFRAAYEDCVVQLVPADEVSRYISGDLSPASAVESLNEQTLVSLDCVSDEFDWDIVSPLPLQESGRVDFQLVLIRSTTSDEEAFRLLQDLESCGGGPAPPGDGSDFSMHRDCTQHSHDGEDEHQHGDCG